MDNRSEGIGRLRAAMATKQPGFERMVNAGPRVRARFQPLFAAERLPSLAKEEFQSFLVFKNNQHWVGLHRKGPEICADMPRLRSALRVLLDESRPIEDRLQDLAPGGPSAVHGLGRAALTAILLVMFPEKYGVWNNRSQGSMEMLGLWPQFDRGEPFGSRYRRVNQVLLDVAREIGTDLWTLDGLWWVVVADSDSEESAELDLVQEGEEGTPEDSPRFGLERHLHEFLRDNWSRTSLGEEWDLHVEDGEMVGYEYPTPIGRIDLLARHKKDKKWLVVELKRNQSSDDTVGQIARYIGYVRETLAKDKDDVQGLIISRAGDEKLRYALSVIANVDLMVYEVDFRLRRPKGATRKE